MDPTVRAVLAIGIRWIHLVSVVTLIGGFVFARFALAPALSSLPESERTRLESRAAARFRPLLYTLIVTILGSGLYNYAARPSHALAYNVWFGIKLVLVLHIFAVGILYVSKDVEESKRNRWLIGLVISGLIVIAISGCLRWISLG
jgi:uncharacterized membrane protein